MLLEFLLCAAGLAAVYWFAYCLTKDE